MLILSFTHCHLTCIYSTYTCSTSQALTSRTSSQREANVTSQDNHWAQKTGGERFIVPRRVSNDACLVNILSTSIRFQRLVYMSLALVCL